MTLKDLKINNTWSLFLDRDGVINHRIVDDYVRCWDQFQFNPGVREALKDLSGMFGRIIVVSNQQGIGKGLMNESDLHQIHEKMVSAIMKKGGRIDKIYFCPFLESAGSVMRKPNIGMALKARKEFPDMRFKRSAMAGDSISDMIFGKRLKMVTVFLSDDRNAVSRHSQLIDIVCKDLLSFAALLRK